MVNSKLLSNFPIQKTILEKHQFILSKNTMITPKLVMKVYKVPQWKLFIFISQLLGSYLRLLKSVKVIGK